MVTLSSDLVTQLTFLVSINTLEILVAASPVGCTMSSLSEGEVFENHDAKLIACREEFIHRVDTTTPYS